VEGKKQKPVCKELEGKKYVPFVNNPSNYGVHNQSSSPWKKTGSTTTRSGQTNNAAPTFLNVEGNKKNPYAGYVSEELFVGIATNGCCFCEAPIKYGDTGITIYVDDDIILCPKHSSFADKGKTRIYVKYLPSSIAA
jgi:hypothetical protein